MHWTFWWTQRKNQRHVAGRRRKSRELGEFTHSIKGFWIDEARQTSACFCSLLSIHAALKGTTLAKSVLIFLNSASFSVLNPSPNYHFRRVQDSGLSTLCTLMICTPSLSNFSLSLSTVASYLVYFLVLCLAVSRDSSTGSSLTSILFNCYSAIWFEHSSFQFWFNSGSQLSFLLLAGFSPDMCWHCCNSNMFKMELLPNILWMFSLYSFENLWRFDPNKWTWLGIIKKNHYALFLSHLALALLYPITLCIDIIYLALGQGSLAA